jgi:hypothetical protein
LEDRKREKREDIKKGKSRFDDESPSSLFLDILRRPIHLKKIYISKPEACQPFSSKSFSP